MKGAKNTVDLNTLKSVKNYAHGEDVTPSYIYKLVKEGKMDLFEIDGVKFVQVDRFPSLPVVNRRNR